MPQTLDFAVVGAEGFALEHIRRLQTYGPAHRARRGALAIRPQDRRRGQVEGYQAQGVEVFADAGEMFTALAGRVAGVFIPTPIHTHCALVIQALRAGHHVFVEKPPAATVQEVDAMIDAARQARRVVAVGFQGLYGHYARFLKDRIVAGALGAVQTIRCRAHWPRNDGYYARNDWAGRLRRDGAWVLDGPSNNALSHQIAAMLYLAENRPHATAVPTAVRAELYHARPIESEDTAAIEIHTEGGALLHFLASHCTGRTDNPVLLGRCQRGSFVWRHEAKVEIAYDDGRREVFETPAPAPAEALASFVRAVADKDPAAVGCTLEMARNFTLALNGAFESAGTIAPIDPGLVGREGEGDKARTLVAGLDEQIDACAAEGKLYSDLGCPWAVATAPFDLRGYRRFPARFAGGP